MTAYDEDILTNPSYIRERVVLDRLLESFLVTPLDYSTISRVDKNGLIISARILSYGKDYPVQVTNPKTSNTLQRIVDLNKLKHSEFNLVSDENGEFDYELTNGTKLNGAVLEAGTVLADNVVSTYVYAGYIDADKINAGLITGVDIDISTDSSSGRFKTSYVRSGPVDSTGITSTAINAVAFVSTTTSGWVTSCYPYYNGAADLGLGSFRWRRLLIGNGNYGEPVDSYIDLGGNVTRLFANGRIYANTLGTSSTAPSPSSGPPYTVVQDSSGFLRADVTSSSRRYKENIIELDTTGYDSIIAKLKPVSYNFKSDRVRPEEYGIEQWGLIAEDVNDIPGAQGLVYRKDGEIESVLYELLPTYFIGAIKEISKKIDLISSRLDALEA
jgi:hypothetical protein